MKRIGPRTVPWGTPHNTGAGLDKAPLAATWSVLFERKLCNQAPTRPPIRFSLSLLHNKRWSTLSKALAKSKYMVSISLPDSRILTRDSVWLIS